ncbi:hypothetical protein, partial [Oceanibaculum pacificum]
MRWTATLMGAALLAGCTMAGDGSPTAGRPGAALLPPAPLPEYAPGDTFVYRTAGGQVREQVLALTPETVAWTDDQGQIWTTRYDVVSPMISWEKDPELGRGRQNVVQGDPADLFPLQTGQEVAFKVEGSSEKWPSGWTMEQNCKVIEQAAITVEAGAFNTFQISCQRGNHLETLYYSPVVQNYVLRVREFPFGTQRKELASYTHASLPMQQAAEPPAMMAPAPMMAAPGAMALSPAEMQALATRLEVAIARLEQLTGGRPPAAAAAAPPRPAPPPA